MNFPGSPTIGDTYSLGTKTWKWNGVAWDLQSTALTSSNVVTALGYTPYDAADLSTDLSPYLLSATAASTYQTQSGMSSYLTSSTAASTYAPLASPIFSGNVGIGTSSPGAKLHAVGNLRSSNGAGTLYTQIAYDGIYSSGTDLYLFAPTGYANIFYANNTEQMRVVANGLVIGAVSVRASAKLDIRGNSLVLGENATYYGTIDYNAGTGFLSLAAESGGGILFKSGTTEKGRIDSSGNFTATGNITAYSDERLKTDWLNLPDDFIDRLARVKHGTYTRIDGGQRQIGVSAQSLQGVAPEGVLDGERLSVAYGNVALASAVELAKRVVRLEKALASMIGD